MKMTNPIHETTPNPIEIMLNLLAESEAFFARTISPAAYAKFTSEEAICTQALLSTSFDR